MNNVDTNPSGLPLPLRLLRWFCPDHLYEEIEGDILQRLSRDIKSLGERSARRRMLWNTILFFRPGIFLRKVSSSSFPESFSGTLEFSLTNKISGWFVFTVALLVYFLTVEETASYWDCSEFIAASYKLQVPHPPGAPLFLLLGRLFSFLSFGDVTKVAYAMNLMSALASAGTILFLFWSIVFVGRKLMGISDNKSPGSHQIYLLMAAGTVGSLAYAFTDSFWFSAVEAEVYAMSSFFTALVVWAVLKWESIKDPAKANRWLLLIAYVIGLSIGVHLLNLLALPALVLIYYFKTYKTSGWGIFAALAASGFLVLAINDLIIPGLPTLAGYFELYFVNVLGLFFGSGALTFSLTIVGVLVFGIHYTQKNRYAMGNTFILGIAFILIGYGSYALIVIRSNADTPINENAPKDVMSFVRYLKREQYGSRPLLFGPYFTARPIGYEYGGMTYVKGKDKYELSEQRVGYKYQPGEETILPRAWDTKEKDAYQQIMNLKEGQRPTFVQNLSYMFSHQMGTMYWRYFLWNFAGRESDEQGAGWLTPSQWFKSVPEALALNKARNNFFMIPLLMGIMGMGYQYWKDKRNFSVIALLFGMMGLAIVFYLNSPPTEPRERDYIYVGSYYAFAIWIGLAVLAFAEIMGRVLENRKSVLAIASMIGLLAPAVLLMEGWDDHNRSNRFFSVDSASNMLNSCDKNGIIFTGGDNDTFPLWYAQETEGCRTDLRVLVLSYCNTDWYIDQTTRQAYQSMPFHYTLTPRQYRQGGPNDFLPFANAGIKSMDAKEYLDLLAKDFPGLRNEEYNVVPSKILTLDIDKDALISKGIIPNGMEGNIVGQMQIKLLKDHLEKVDLAFLDILVTTQWERPIYLNNTSLSQLNLDVSPYIVQEGNAFRVLPVTNPRSDRPHLVDTEKTFDLMVNQFKYCGLDDPSVYYTNDYRTQVLMHRTNFNSLAQALMDEDKVERAGKSLLFSLEKMPYDVISYDPSTPDTVNLLFQAGQKEKALEISRTVGAQANEMAGYLIAEGGSLSFSLRKELFVLGALQRNLYEQGETSLARQLENDYDRLIADLERGLETGRIIN